MKTMYSVPGSALSNTKFIYKLEGDKDIVEDVKGKTEEVSQEMIEKRIDDSLNLMGSPDDQIDFLEKKLEEVCKQAYETQEGARKELMIILDKLFEDIKEDKKWRILDYKRVLNLKDVDTPSILKRITGGPFREKNQSSLENAKMIQQFKKHNDKIKPYSEEDSIIAGHNGFSNNYFNIVIPIQDVDPLFITKEPVENRKKREDVLRVQWQEEQEKIKEEEKANE